MTCRTSRSPSAALTLALAGALLLTACGGGGEDQPAAHESAAGSGTSTEHGGGSASTGTGTGNDADADVDFLTGMKPHHEQAVEMSDLVLAADPPAPVAELARQVRAAQAPEIEQMEQMLDDLDQDVGSHSGAHGGMLSEADLRTLEEATGTDAARIYLEAMVEHHRGAIEAAEAEIAAGEHEPAVELARRIAEDQAAEIPKMQALLAAL